MARDGSNKVCSSEIVLGHPQFGIVNGFGMLYGIHQQNPDQLRRS